MKVNLERFDPARIPAKYTHLPEIGDDAPSHARQGQAIVMFAFFAIALMGLLGLATDVGYAMAARRAAQGAADQGALSGARVIARYGNGGPSSAQAEVGLVVSSNPFGPVAATLFKCEYIGNNWAVVGTCNQTVPSNAAGARVRTRVTVDTFFLQVIPGAPDQVIASGYAKARVEKPASVGSDAPFIVCGKASWAVNDVNGGAIDANIPILNGSNQFNANAIGVTYRIHDPQLKNHYEADCKSKAARFKGLADQGKAQPSGPGWFYYDTGTKAGPTRAKVYGTQGCAANTPEPYNCVMILPIATNSPAESGNSKQVYVVTFGAFEVTTVDSNSHNGKFLGIYLITGGDSTASWSRGQSLATIRLIW